MNYLNFRLYMSHKLGQQKCTVRISAFIWAINHSNFQRFWHFRLYLSFREENAQQILENCTTDPTLWTLQYTKYAQIQIFSGFSQSFPTVVELKILNSYILGHLRGGLLFFSPYVSTIIPEATSRPNQVCIKNIQTTFFGRLLL